MALQSMMDDSLKTLKNFMPAAFYVFSFLGGSAFAAENSFWSVNADNTDFGIASNTGVLRYYRHNRQTPLIEYLSLGEDKAFQVEYKSVKWSYKWKDGSLSLKKGNGLKESTEEKTARIMPLYFLTPESGVIEFESKGKLFSDWTENFRFARQKNGSSLEISCSRAKADRNASFVFKFMRWIDEEGVCFFAGSADGKLTRLHPGHKITGREVIIPFARKGCVLRISTDTEAKISLSDILTFVGGRTLAFEFGEAKNFKITVDDTENVKTCKLDNLILNVDNSNGTSCIEAGGMPLLFLDGFEGETRQSAGIGKKAQWQISETGSHDRKLIKLSGRVKSRWNGVISAANDSIDYSFSSSGPGGIGTVMEFPSGLVGCPLEILLPNGKTVKSHKNIPLRIGADIELGQLPSGTQLAIRLTNTEQLLIKAGAAFSLRSFQSFLSPYSSAFDSSDEEDLAKIKSKRVVHTFPSGGLIFSGGPGEKISLNLTYRQSCRTCPAVKISDPVYSGKINISEVPDGISVESPWWKIIHSKAAGGGMAAIVFRNVSGKNILSAPEKIHVLSGGKEFSNIHDRKATFLQDGKKLTVNGMLTSADGGACGISYTLHYEYHDGYIKRKTVLHAEKPVKTERIGILKLDFTPELDHCGYKPFVAAFRKAVFPGPPIVESSNFGCGFLSVYRTGGEGVDFVPGSNVLQWTTQLSNDNNARRWSIAGNAAGGPSIIIEPYCKPGKPVNFQGSASFDYYIGLPKLNSTFVHNYFPANFPVWFYKEKNWPSAEAIRKLAEYGVTLSLDGNYESNWVGQQVPENASASKQAKLKAIADRIAEWHRQGIKVVPFIGKGLIKENIPGYAKPELWGQMNKSRKLSPNPWHATMMCHSAPGFNAAYENFLTGWRNLFKLDGFYFDFVYPQGICYNLNHYPCAHTDADGLTDFMEWARKNFKVVYAHTGYSPAIMYENLADLTWVGEEINYWYSTDGRIPGLEQMRQYFCHVYNTQKLVDPLIVPKWRLLPSEPVSSYLGYTGSDCAEFTCRMALCGLFSGAYVQAAGAYNAGAVFKRLAPWLAMFQTFKDVDFTKLAFKDWKNQNSVLTGNAAVKAAVYWNDDNAYVIAGNPESGRRETYRLRLAPEMLGWNGSRNYAVRLLPPAQAMPVSPEELTGRGINGTLQPYQYHVYKIEVKK